MHLDFNHNGNKKEIPKGKQKAETQLNSCIKWGVVTPFYSTLPGPWALQLDVDLAKLTHHHVDRTLGVHCLSVPCP